MDKAVFVKELRDIFANINSNERRYSKVWLGDENFGGLYHSGMYFLNLKAEHQIPSYRSEVGFLLVLLREKMGLEKASSIFSIEVFYPNDIVRIGRDDIIIYNDEIAYNAA